MMGMFRVRARRMACLIFAEELVSKMQMSSFCRWDTVLASLAPLLSLRKFIESLEYM